jgi:hypothetical protein
LKLVEQVADGDAPEQGRDRQLRTCSHGASPSPDAGASVEPTVVREGSCQPAPSTVLCFAIRLSYPLKQVTGVVGRIDRAASYAPRRDRRLRVSARPPTGRSVMELASTAITFSLGPDSRHAYR